MPFPKSSSVPRNADVDAQTLLIDLDDTLCENNIYFEDAIANFISYLNHEHYSRDEVREFLNQAERESILAHGYGLNSFARSLVACFERLSSEPVDEERHRTISSFAHQIADHPMELLPDVPETLNYLSTRHHLIIMTKGNLLEQTGKIERSGLLPLFHAAEVVPEKNVATYNQVIEKYALEPASTWMVGNSPKSDVNPALAAGLHAVFIPHPSTWVLEHEEVAPVPTPAQKLLVLQRFSDLRNHF